MARRSWDCSDGATDDSRSQTLEGGGQFPFWKINGLSNRARNPLRHCSEGASMSCPRCKGFIIQEYLVNEREGSLSGFHGWRCVNCGAIGDKVIQSNRRKPLSWQDVPISTTVESSLSYFPSEDGSATHRYTKMKLVTD